MRRTDRLYDLLATLRDGRLHRAEDIARALNVSKRTIYRDIETLQRSGIPVEGERGVGYRLSAPISLPPINLTHLELEALHLGLAIVSEATDPDLSTAARSLSDKIDAVVPSDSQPVAENWNFATYPFASSAAGFGHMPTLRAAIQARQKVRLKYLSVEGSDATHIVRPLQLEYWGRVWTLTTFSELTEDFQAFRVDRIARLDVLPELFIDEQGRTLDDYIHRLVR